MKRRDFIKLAGVSAALFPVAPSVFAQQVIPSRRHTYRLTYKFDLPADGKKSPLMGTITRHRRYTPPVFSRQRLERQSDCCQVRYHSRNIFSHVLR